MAKVFVYTIILIGLSVLLSLGGIGTLSFHLVNAFMGTNTITPTGAFNSTAIDVQNSGISTKVYYILGLGVAFAIIAGLYSRISPESFIRGGLAILLFGYVIADLSSIIVYARSSYDTWIANFITLIILPLIAGYVIAIVSWWGGQDI
jgi:hypothetical protein